MSDNALAKHLIGAAVTAVAGVAGVAISFAMVGQFEVSHTIQQIDQAAANTERLNIENAITIAETLNTIRPNFAVSSTHDVYHQGYVIDLEIVNHGSLAINCTFSDLHTDRDGYSMRFDFHPGEISPGASKSQFYYADHDEGGELGDNDRIKFSAQVNCTTLETSSRAFVDAVAELTDEDVIQRQLRRSETNDHFVYSIDGQTTWFGLLSRN